MTNHDLLETQSKKASAMTGTNALRTLARTLLGAIAVLTLSGVGAAGCIEPGPQINRVQTNLLDKSVFEGEWWFTHTVVDLADDASWAIGQAGAGAPWPGATANFDIASQSGVVGRIRWVIDENTLYAYRSHEIVRGSSDDARSPDGRPSPEFRGQPLAAYRIQGHFDIRQDFNTVTGEPINVVVEAQDRRWYDRRYIRVDWSQNLVSFGLFGASLEIEQLFGGFRREPVPLGITDEGNRDLPAEWAPQIATLAQERPCSVPAGGEEPVAQPGCYRFLGEWGNAPTNTVHYLSFVTQELWTPLQCFGSLCNTSVSITLRDAFLRIPPEHEYAVETLVNSEYDRFGIIRTESRTFVRGGADRGVLSRYCATDRDCDPGCDPDLGIMCEVSCDTASHTCQGGLTNELGETDFLTFYRLRHNFYSDSLYNDRPCQADWQCSDRYSDAPGGETRDGSVCDQNARLCTIPIAQRPVRPVHYTLSPHYPAYLVRSSFEIVATWNESFMRANRALRGMPTPTGPDVACQGADPTAYCFCSGTTLAAEVDPATMSCRHQSNWFVAPGMRGETDPFDCWVQGPADIASPTDFTDYEVDADGDGAMDVYGHRFVGTECMLVLDTNSCDRISGAACEQLGDVRYQFFNYVSGAGAGWCGVMQPNQDPMTGEAILSPVNMGGLCLDNISQRAMTIFPILRGEESADPLFQGEELRSYFESLGRVRRPIGLAPGADAGDTGSGARPGLPADLHAHFEELIESSLPRVRGLGGEEGRAHVLSSRLRTLEGTSIERRMVDSVAHEAYGAMSSRPAERMLAGFRSTTGAAPGVVPQSVADGFLDDATRQRLTPFGDDFMNELLVDRRREEAISATGTCMMFEDEYNLIDQYNWYWAQAFAGVALPTARIRWAQAWHRAVMQHELGHGLGLEHNFAASLDRDHYLDGYYRIEEELPLPRITEARFDVDRNGILTDVEARAWLTEFQRVRTERQQRGIGNYTTSSTMDYGGDLSDIMTIGRYDHAAVYYNYFNLIEAFNGDPRLSEPATSRDGLIQSNAFDRTLWTWYRGGESCRVDAQCPHTQGAASLTPGQDIYQRCVANPRYSPIPVPCTEIGDPEEQSHCICSNFDEDFVDYEAGLAYRSGGPLEHYPVQYLFCSNSRLNDISWCNTFDSGESFLEVLANMRTAWEQSYPLSYFRRFRRPFTSGARSTRWIPDAAKIFQHLYFRYIYEPSFRSDSGPLGFDDQFQASIDSMNFFSYLAQLPDVGSYERDDVTGTFRHMGEEMGMAGADFSLDRGQGFHMWSRYQEGLLGFWRLERAGVFWDKLIALRALTLRDWNLGFTVDERFFINYYDLFPVEMTELFGGYVLDDPTWFAPRVDTSGPEPIVEYVNWYRGNCRSATTGGIEPCREDNPTVFPGTPIEGTSNDILRTYAAVFALAEFPVFYDSSWERRLAIFKLGSGDGFRVPDLQRDGSQTCAFGTSRTEPTHRSGCTAEDADYIVYTSDARHTSYVAVKIRNRIDFNLEEEQLGFQLLLEMSANRDAIRALAALPTRNMAQEAELRQRRERLDRDESFLETLIEIQRIFGITSYL